MARSIPTSPPTPTPYGAKHTYQEKARDHYANADRALSNAEWDAAIAFSLAGMLANQNADHPR